DPVAWKIVYIFAMTEMSLPNAERDLQACLGERYLDSDWRLALKAVIDAEGDTKIALNAVEALKQAASCCTGLKIWIPTIPAIPTAACPRPDQLSSAEAELMQSVNNLKTWNRIFSELPSLEEILDHAKERDMGEFLMFEGGDEAIADEGCHKIVAANEVIEV
ncbi:uncharacterized protein EDB91DRAFT_1031031, partial [Suillus paluster]|uniref:uncharacterized protein n=1 Tax=Suillus paluster TaxID=48578 RepID=UPI001B864787